MILEFWQGPGDPVMGLAAVVRWLGLVGGLGAAGAALFLVFMSERLTVEEARAARRWLVVLVVLGVAAAAALWPLRAVLLSGVRDGAARWPLYAEIARSGFGEASYLKAAGFALLLFARVRTAWGAGLATAGALLVVMGLALAGHAADHRLRQELMALTILHLAAAAFWFGSLLPLRNVALRRDPRSAGEAILAWSRPAGLAVVLALATGLAIAFVLMGAPAGLPRAPAGWILAAKAVTIAAMLAGALACRFRHTRLLLRGDVLAGGAFRRSANRQILLALLALYLSAELGGAGVR